jgi:hypothetical protein
VTLELSAGKLSDQIRDFDRMRLKRKTASIQQVYLCIRQVATVGLRPGGASPASKGVS